MAERRGRPPAELLAEFREVTATRLADLRAMTDEEMAAEIDGPIGRMPYGAFMEVRAMDCWVHEQDIRRATGRPGDLDSTVAKASVDRFTSGLGYVVGKRSGAPTAPPSWSAARADRRSGRGGHDRWQGPACRPAPCQRRRDADHDGRDLCLPVVRPMVPGRGDGRRPGRSRRETRRWPAASSTADVDHSRSPSLPVGQARAERSLSRLSAMSEKYVGFLVGSVAVRPSMGSSTSVLACASRASAPAAAPAGLPGPSRGSVKTVVSPLVLTSFASWASRPGSGPAERRRPADGRVRQPVSGRQPAECVSGGDQVLAAQAGQAGAVADVERAQGGDRNPGRRGR